MPAITKKPASPKANSATSNASAPAKRSAFTVQATAPRPIPATAPAR